MPFDTCHLSLFLKKAESTVVLLLSGHLDGCTQISTWVKGQYTTQYPMMTHFRAQVPATSTGSCPTSRPVSTVVQLLPVQLLYGSYRSGFKSILMVHVPAMVPEV